jgi:hypothetical protein
MHSLAHEYEAAAERIRNRGEKVSEDVLAKERGIELGSLRAYLVCHQSVALTTGLVVNYGRGQRLKQKNRRPYVDAANSIRARCQKVTYDSLASELGFSRNRVERYLSARQNFKKRLGVENCVR